MKKIKVINIGCCDLDKGHETMLYENGDEFETTGLNKSFRKQYYSTMHHLDEDFHGIVLDNKDMFCSVGIFTDKIEFI